MKISDLSTIKNLSPKEAENVCGGRIILPRRAHTGYGNIYRRPWWSKYRYR